MLFYDFIQTVQRKVYETELIELLMLTVVPKLKELFDPASQEFIDMYKMIVAITKIINPKVPVLVKAESDDWDTKLWKKEGFVLMIIFLYQKLEIKCSYILSRWKPWRYLLYRFNKTRASRRHVRLGTQTKPFRESLTSLINKTSEIKAAL